MITNLLKNKNSIAKGILIASLLMVYNFGFAQSEVEPNNDCSSGNAITSLATYSGISDNNADYWIVYPQSTGTITLRAESQGGTITVQAIFLNTANPCGSNFGIANPAIFTDYNINVTATGGGGNAGVGFPFLIKVTNEFFSFAGPDAYTLKLSSANVVLGSPPVVAPGGVADPNLWYKADDGVTTGSTFSWANKGSILNADASSTVVAHQPVYNTSGANQINFNPSLSFDGVDDHIQTPLLSNYLGTDASSDRIATQFVVYKKLGSNNTFMYNIDNGDLSAQGSAIYLGGKTDGELIQESYRIDDQATTAENETALVDMVATSSATPAFISMNLQKNSVNNQKPLANSHIDATDNHPLRFGRFGNNYGHFAISELVVYTKRLNATDRLKVQSYLALKYGLSLGNNQLGPIYLDSAGSLIFNESIFFYDIFGIGKDNGSTLNQTSSNSVNTGSGNGTGQSGKGNIVVSNPTALEDKDFLIIGHNNAALTEQTTDVPADLPNEERLSREWKVKVTNTPGAVDLSFNTNGLTVTGTTLTDFVLMIDTDNDGDFTTGTVTELSPISYTGGVLLFHNVTFADGNVFAFATGRAPNIWNGTAWSSGIPPTSTTDAVINGNYNVSGAVNLTTEKLTINSGFTVTINPGQKLTAAGHIVNNGSIVFKSDATGSGHFDTYTSSPITGTGSVTTERYIPARRAFRFLSPSVSTTGNIAANWQESSAVVSNLGTHITGLNGATNGFDVTASNNPSLFYYKIDSQTWNPIVSTNSNNLYAGNAYRLLVRGDRTIDLSTNTPTPTNTVLRTTGALHTGNFLPTLATGANEFSFIGNPYQAPIDIKAILTASTNMDQNVVYFWDPTLNTRGAYVTRDLSVDTNSPSSSVTQYVQAGQAVFVKKDNTANAATMTISETHKSLGNAAAGVFKTKANDKVAIVTSKLTLELNSPAVNAVLDGATILFDDSYSWNAVSGEDHTKFANLDEQLSLNHQSINLAIAKQSFPNEQDELVLSVNNYRQSSYQWKFSLQNYSGQKPLLYDALNQTYTEIIDGNTMNFSVDTQVAASTAANRFKIVFSNKTLGTTKFDVAGIKLYPNPAKAGVMQDFVLSNIQSNSSVKLYNTLGQEILLKTIFEGNQLRVTPNEVLSAGIYLVQVNQDGNSNTIKWIVK